MLIEKISGKITKYLISSDVISDSSESVQYYQYGIEITISSFLNIIEIIIIGLIFHQLTEAVIFLLIFIPLRLFTGGYHASTYFRCNLYFCILFTILLITYNISLNSIANYECLLIALINEVTVITECPIINHNNPITQSEKNKNKIIAVILGAVINLTGILLTYLSFKIGVLVLYTHLTVSILIIVAMIMNERRKSSYEKE